MLLNLNLKKQEEDDYCEKDEEGNYKPESFTYTFYKFATIKGYVDIPLVWRIKRVLLESVDFEKADENGEFDCW